ncbi:hypothetical protein MRX96_008786 [Rhipicephalus microplus]
MDHSDGKLFKNAKYDGIFGLAFPSISQNNQLPLFDAMVKQGVVRQGRVLASPEQAAQRAKWRRNLFSEASTQDATRATYIMLPSTRPVTGRSPWTTWTSKARKLCIGGCNAVVDSGTSFVSGPQKDVETLHKVIGAKRTGPGYYEVDCNEISKLPPITFNLNGKAFPLKGEDYTIKIPVQGGVQCFTRISEEERSELWILGALFTQSYYTVFDRSQNRVGFATAV